MDTITGMRTFCAVAQQRSFTKAASVLGISPALTSKYIGQLEDRLGVRLLNRTTRSLSLTEQGQRYFDQCLPVLSDFDALEASVQENQTRPKGLIRVSAPRVLGEDFLMSTLAEFMEAHPEITVEVHLSDRFVNVVQEGFDLAIRGGALEDSALMVRKLAPMQILLCATPAYLKQAGTPATPEDLSQHQCIIDSNFKGGNMWPFVQNGESGVIAVQGRLTVNSATACRDMALRGIGIIRCPDHVVAHELAAGQLVQVLADSTPVHLGIYAVYPHRRHLAAKTRVLLDHLAAFFGGNCAVALSKNTLAI